LSNHPKTLTNDGVRFIFEDSKRGPPITKKLIYRKESGFPLSWTQGSIL